MKKIMLLGALIIVQMTAQISMAAQLTSVARVDLTKTTALPSTRFYSGPELEFQLIKTMVTDQIVWDGYDKEYICTGDTHRGVDGEVECDVDEVLTWVPRVKLTNVKEVLRSHIMTTTGYDEQVSSRNSEYSLPRTCIQNYESYRYTGAEAPTDANAQLTVTADCAVYVLDNTIVYFEKARALKNNYMSASLYRTGLMHLGLTQPLTLTRNASVALPSQPRIAMNAQRPGEYPVLALLGLTPDKQTNLFGQGYLYPTLNDKK